MTVAEIEEKEKKVKERTCILVNVKNDKNQLINWTRHSYF